MISGIDKKTPIDRITYTGSLDPVVGRLCVAYGIGTLQDYSIIEVGYEDCNVIVQTEQGKFLAKIFSKVRSQEDITRYACTLKKVVDAGVNHPPLKTTHSGDIVYTDLQASGLEVVLMEFIIGGTFFELNRAPSPMERKSILEQAAQINRIEYHPPYIVDSWAIPNIQAMFDRTKEFIQPGDLKLVNEVIKKYYTIPVDTLPHCFVHGDFTKTNILKGSDEKIYILDFSVANWYPRIQELAVISANLMHDDIDTISIQKRTELVADEYNNFNTLTSSERQHLYNYTLAGVAMEFMGSHQEKYINGNDTEETDYWLRLGRTGLQKELT